MLLAGEQDPSMHPTFPGGLWPHGRAPQPNGAGHHQHGDRAKVCPGHSRSPLLLPGLHLPQHLLLNLLNLILQQALPSLYLVYLNKFLNFFLILFCAMPNH